MSGYYFDESGVRRIVAAVRRVENESRNTPLNLPPMVSSGTSETYIECKNNASETIPAYSVVSLTTGTTLDGRKIPYAVKPSTTFYPLHGFTCSLDSASTSKVGVIQETGLVKYDTGTPVTGEGWGIKPGQYTLSKGYPGARCIEVVDTTNKIMRAEFLPITTLLGKTTAAATANTPTTSWIILSGDAGSEVDAGFTTVPSAVCPVALGNNTKVVLKWVDNQWQMLPYANWLWHVTLSSSIAGGASGTVTLPDGRSVTATNWSGSDFVNLDKVSVYEDVTDGNFYIIGGGAGADKTAVVRVYSTTPDANCMWAGKVGQLATSQPTGYCTDQFTNGADCFIVVLNSDLGSVATSKITLSMSEAYVGRLIAQFDIGGGVLRNVYAVRVEDNYLYHLTIPSTGAPVSAGGTISVTLPTGEVVTATNWSAVTLAYADKVSAYKDLTNGTWYLIKSGGTSTFQLVEGTVYSAFTKDTDRFQVVITRGYTGSVTPGDRIEVLNYVDPGSSPKPYLFEGETGACCSVIYDGNTGFYRANWVECPEGPVNVSPGETGGSMSDLYSYGGMDQSELDSNYY